MKLLTPAQIKWNPSPKPTKTAKQQTPISRNQKNRNPNKRNREEKTEIWSSPATPASNPDSGGRKGWSQKAAERKTPAPRIRRARQRKENALRIPTSLVEQQHSQEEVEVSITASGIWGGSSILPMSKASVEAFSFFGIMLWRRRWGEDEKEEGNGEEEKGSSYGHLVFWVFVYCNCW